VRRDGLGARPRPDRCDHENESQGRRYRRSPAGPGRGPVRHPHRDHDLFTNRNQSGRTGRGDTTISAYLARRKTHPPTEALRFAAALASIKMETPGPFAGTLADVKERMEEM